MAYTSAVLVQKDPPAPDGRVALTVEFTGPGEDTKRVLRWLDGGDTIASLQAWARAEGTRLSSRKTIADSLNVGATVSLTPPAPPVPTAEDIWRAKVSRYLAAQQLALTNATAVSDRNALFADINATYLTAYL